jgi:hypothetical protein
VVEARAAGREALLASGFALVHALWVVKVGGDFMYARLLIPSTPFFAIALELAIGPLAARLAARRPTIPALAAALVLAQTAFAHLPFQGLGWVRGIVDERGYYDARERAEAHQMALDLAALVRGLPVRVAIAGAQARLAYEADLPVAIEASAGLTDAYVAHLPLLERGRVGHEKQAPLSYLIDQRRVHFVIGGSRIFEDSLRAYAPAFTMRYRSLRATLLTWDPAVMSELRRRGAECDDFLAYLDRFIAEMPTFPDSMVAEVYAKSRRYYFAGVRDPAREAPFLKRLGSAAGPANSP